MTAYQKYLRQLNSNLTCSPADRKKFIDDIMPLLDEFYNNNPQASMIDYIRQFGSPEALANSLLSTLDQTEVTKFKKRKNLKKRSIIICVAAIILLIFGALFWYIHFINIHQVHLEGESELIIIDRTDPDGIYESAYNDLSNNGE